MSRKITFTEILEIAAERNHNLVFPKDPIEFETHYKGVNSSLEFNCLTCENLFTTTLHSYKNARKTGCPHCKRLVASKTHKNKEVSQETRDLISQKSNDRFNNGAKGSLTDRTGENHPRYKGGYGRDKNSRSSLDYAWIKGVKELCQKKCVLTEVTTNLVCHHLEGWNHCPERRYDISNGVCLSEKIHNDFHLQYGFGNNTEKQFIEFCQKNNNVDWLILKENLWQSSAKLNPEL